MAGKEYHFSFQKRRPKYIFDHIAKVCSFFLHVCLVSGLICLLNLLCTIRKFFILFQMFIRKHRPLELVRQVAHEQHRSVANARWPLSSNDPSLLASSMASDGKGGSTNSASHFYKATEGVTCLYRPRNMADGLRRPP